MITFSNPSTMGDGDYLLAAHDNGSTGSWTSTEQPNTETERIAREWKVDETGAYIDGMKISDVTISDLSISENESIKLRIGIKEDARNVGGINLFGRKFGNYKQDIVLRYRYKYTS